MAFDVGTAVGYLDLDTSKFKSGFASALADLKTFASSTGTVQDKLTALQSAFSTAGSTLTKTFTLPIVALGTAAVTQSTTFESAMSNVSAISGATGTELEALTEKAKEMGATTKFSASESAEAFKYMAMAGWDTEDMLNSIGGVMSLAAASGEDLGTVSDIVTDAMTAFGLSADGTSTVLKDGLEVEVSNCTRFVDALAAASNSSNTNVSMLGESFKYVAPVAGALGYSVEDVAVALGTMANQGIKSSQAGTALRTILTNMANPTDNMSWAMDQLGVSLENDDGSMKSLMEVMQDLRAGFGGGSMDAEEFTAKMTELDDALSAGTITEDEYNASVEDLATAMYGAEGAEKAQLAAILAGKTGMAGLLAIVNATDEDFQSLTDSIYNASGTAEEMSDVQLNNLSGQLTILKSTLEGIAISFGDIMLPAVKKVVEKLQELLSWINGLSDAQKTTIVKIAAVVAAIGPALLILSKVIGVINTILPLIQLIGTGLKTLFAIMAANPITIVIAAIAALVAGFIYLWNNCEEFRNFWINLWESIKEIASTVIDALVNFFTVTLPEAWDAALTAVSNFITSVIEWFQQLPKNVSTFIDKVFTAIKTWATNMVNKAKELGKNFLNAIVQFFTQLPGKVYSFITTALNNVAAWATNMKNKAIETGKNFLNAIVEFFNELPYKVGYLIGLALGNIIAWAIDMKDKAVETGTNFLNAIVQFFTQLPGKIYDFITSAKDRVITWATEMKDKAIETGKNFLNAIVGFFTQLPGKIYDFITSALSKISTWAIEVKNKAVETGKNFLNAIVEYFTQLPGKVYSSITTALNNVSTWATNMITKAKELGTNFLNAVIQFFTQLPSKIKEKLTEALSKVATWAIDLKSKGTEAAKALYNAVVDGITSLPSKMKDIGKNIVSGIWEGIQNAKTWLVNKVKSFASGILDGIKSALGIHSPSKEGAWIGEMLDKGIANGILGSVKTVMKSAITMTRSLKNTLEDELDAMDVSGMIKDTLSVADTVLAGTGSLYDSDGIPLTSKKSAVSLTDTTKASTTQTGGNTYIFNSPEAVTPTVAAKLMKQTAQQLALSMA